MSSNLSTELAVSRALNRNMDLKSQFAQNSNITDPYSIKDYMQRDLQRHGSLQPARSTRKVSVRQVSDTMLGAEFRISDFYKDNGPFRELYRPMPSQSVMLLKKLNGLEDEAMQQLHVHPLMQSI
jgi:hypothetical protein